MLSLMLMMAAVQQPALCSAAPAEVLVGERYRRGVPSRAKRLSGARTVRVMWPGQLVTMDFREDRLNLRVDRRRLITAVRCG
ncbi:MAG: hypothetical protein JWN21_1205 [Sphingomonas bacterium]|uniref:I78 family peptidase inhibitor n=1 Tax=Sphingomonas bacterium TaxID=1895847 RepID=UPI0026084931|nr:I78 family peptidase inhibitor [Sphingomonas bacterium]MDB5695662.1 hypothetical protein [Sphingomonas bacterium]